MPLTPAVDQPAGSTRTLLREPAGDGRVGSVVRRTVLPGGLRVVTESMPGARSATLGIWVGTGSRDETPRLAGATHFLEHLLFKGTRRRTAWDISAELDAVGGELNAFTGKEFTCYHARVLGADVPLAVDVLCDMVTSSLIPSAEVEAERSVILEEIALHEDDHDELVHDEFVAQLYGDTPLGRPIAGTPDSISAVTRRQITGFYQRRYTPDRLVFAAAGQVDHAGLVRLVRTAFAAAGPPTGEDMAPAPIREAGRTVDTHPGLRVVERPVESASFVLGMPAYPRGDDRRFAMGVLNFALGGGPSSRLFQEIRERRGLAYSVYSFTSQHVGAGYFAVGGGCTPQRLGDVLGICRDELAKVASAGITVEEFERGKGQLRGSLVLGLEDSSARMTRIAKAELVPGGLLSVDESIQRIDAVSLDDVHDVARQVLDQPLALAVVGPKRAVARLS